jgi:WD40 repeat protein
MPLHKPSAFLVVALIACSHAPSLRSADAEPSKATSGEAAVQKVTFADHVMPIFRQHCLSCHHQGEKKGGLALDDYTSLIEGGGSGEIVFDDGDADSSRLWQVVSHEDTPVMPPNQPKIPDDQLAVIRKWIEGGILENDGSKAKAKKKSALAVVSSSSNRPEGGGAMPALTIPQEVPVVTSRASAISAIGTSPWAPLAAIAGQNQIVLYHTDSAELLGVLPFPEGTAQSLKFSVDGSYLIAGGGEHSVRGIAAIYDVKSGARVATVGDELDIVFGADANPTMTRVAMGGPKKLLRIYDATDGELLFSIKKHTDWIFAVAFSPEGSLIASADRSGGLHVWEAETGRLSLDLVGHKDAVHSLAWRDDGKILASAGEDGTVRLWDVTSGKQLKSINTASGATMAVDMDHDGNLATAQSNKLAKFWDANGVHKKDVKPMSDEVLEIAFTHDGKKIIYGDWTGEVRMAQIDDPSKVQILAANPPAIATRVEATKQLLVTVQQEIAPLKTALDASLTAFTAANQQLQVVTNQIADLQSQSTSLAESAKAKRDEAEKLRTELTQRESIANDLSDAMIVARVAAKSDPNKATALAIAEEQYANHLLGNVHHRRSIEKALAEAMASDKQSADLLAKAKTMEPTRNEAQKQADAMKASLAQSRSAYDSVAKRLHELEAKHQHLLSQVK